MIDEEDEVLVDDEDLSEKETPIPKKNLDKIAIGQKKRAKSNESRNKNKDVTTTGNVSDVSSKQNMPEHLFEIEKRVRVAVICMDKKRSGKPM